MGSGRLRLQVIGVVVGGLVWASSAGAASSAKPSIASVNPATGAVGASVKITGSGFTGAKTVKFGAVTSAFKVNSGKLITTSVPIGAKTAKVTVTTGGGTATSASSFTVGTAAVASGNCADPGTVSLFAGAGANTVPGGQSIGHGQSQVYVQFTYKAACAMSNGVVAISVPSDWTQPVLTNAPGCTTSTAGKLATGNGTITVSGLNLSKGDTVAIVYGELASYGSSTGAQTCAFGDGATAPAASGTSTFSAKVSPSGGSNMVSVTKQPTLTVN
jgi:IPT/TIG domain